MSINRCMKRMMNNMYVFCHHIATLMLLSTNDTIIIVRYDIHDGAHNLGRTNVIF